MLIDQGVPGDDRRTFEKFLNRAGLNEDQLRTEFRPTATERIRRSLVLSRLRELEDIAVTPADIDAEIDRIGGGGPQGEQLRAIFDTESGRETIERTLLSRKTIERMRQIALGEAPDLTEPDTDEAPASDEPAAEPEKIDAIAESETVEAAPTEPSVEAKE